MRSLAIAMLVMGGAGLVVSIGFLLRGASSASGAAILVAASFLLVSGAVTLSRSRE